MDCRSAEKDDKVLIERKLTVDSLVPSGSKNPQHQIIRPERSRIFEDVGYFVVAVDSQPWLMGSFLNKKTKLIITDKYPKSMKAALDFIWNHCLVRKQN